MLLASASIPAVSAVEPIIKSMRGSVAVSQDQRIFTTNERGVFEIVDGKTSEFVSGLQNPSYLLTFQQWLYVADDAGVHRIELGSKKMIPWVEAKAFPKPNAKINSMAVDERGTIYASDPQNHAIYRIGLVFKGRDKEPDRKVTIAADRLKVPVLVQPNGLTMDSMNHLLFINGQSGELIRMRMPDFACDVVETGFTQADSMVMDHFGRLFVLAQGEIWSMPRSGMKKIKVSKVAEGGSGLAFLAKENALLVENAKNGVDSLPAQTPGYEVDETPLKLEPQVVFQDLTWTGWDSGADSGKINPLRPLVLTHAGDGSNRIFVATQHGVIHSFKDEAGPRSTNVFLDIQSKVLYKDNENEQGLLGLAFHPKYKDNGELFVFYTDKSKRLQNVLSRFRVSKTDPNKVDPNSEEELLRVSHKFWNHDGGTICFGPDGYLYLVLGDGGLGGDPDGNGQNKNTLLGKILRLDIDHKDAGLNYAIPRDNPFVGQKDCRAEIYCYGCRNPWRMSFDRKTGQGWFGEVGQNLWEEVNLIQKGGNYGWGVRESMHPFGEKGVGPKPEFVDPIWEYYHSVGKSITGGNVYRGPSLPELDGMYLYADYVSGKLWALKYDFDKKRVVANRPIKDFGSPIMSFGEDEKGETYILTFSASGKGISKFVRSK
ncbi:MAG: PQQ-dependent sugar dehydrogenase [Gemmataceae bacterium]